MTPLSLSFCKMYYYKAVSNGGISTNNHVDKRQKDVYVLGHQVVQYNNTNNTLDSMGPIPGLSNSAIPTTPQEKSTVQ
jgi:hypothetical protein